MQKLLYTNILEEKNISLFNSIPTNSFINEILLTEIFYFVLKKKIPINKQKYFKGRIYKIIHYLKMSFLQKNIVKGSVLFDSKWSVFDNIFDNKNFKMNLVYKQELNSYLYKTILSFLNIKKETRKDKYVELVHHLVTILLLMGSNKYSLKRIGIHILYLHNITDLIYNITRVSGNLGLKSILLNTLYTTMLSIFIYYRLIYFNFKIILPIFRLKKSDFKYLGKIQHNYLLNISFKQINQIHKFFLLGLCSLSLMHMYWIYNGIKILLLKMKSNTSLEELGAEK